MRAVHQSLTLCCTPQENEHHFYYEVFRAASMDELIPTGKSAPSAATSKGRDISSAPVDPKLAKSSASADTANDARIKELEASLAAERASLAAERASLAPSRPGR